MERIKEALERARGQRDEAGPASARPGAKSTPRSHDKAPVEQKIVYTQTRTLEPDLDWLRRHRVIAGPADPVANHYSVLRTHVLQRMRANNWRALAVTSPNEGAGKTLTAINLAISMAREANHTVLLVDLDLKRPSIHRYLWQEKLPGISDHILEDTPLPELLVNPGIERLVVLPGHKALTHSSEMLSSPKMVNLVEDLKNRYPSRLVIFDMPPMLACDDVLAFSPYFDAALLVVAEGDTQKGDLKKSLELLGKTELLGTVLNKSAESTSGYGYY
ncbi:MAG: CpsD/CapB family tyrosine-protein kinase [Gammaproteobacteria bacterium]|nr:CpsD/CapB family tyrosine-protein kinase [Gammaproteobacteria bacterium]